MIRTRLEPIAVGCIHPTDYVSDALMIIRLSKHLNPIGVYYI